MTGQETKLMSFYSTAVRVADIGMYPLSLLIRWVSIWIVLALMFDIPAPAIVHTAPEYPQVTVGLLAFLLFLMAGDAAKHHKREAFGNAE